MATTKLTLPIETDEQFIALYLEYKRTKLSHQAYGNSIGLDVRDLWRKVSIGEYLYKNRKKTRKTSVSRTLTDDELYEKYILDDLTQEEIAYECNVSSATVHHWLKAAEIKKYRDENPTHRRSQHI